MRADDKSTKVLVTGGTGFIGRPLCRRLMDEGQYVVATGRNADGANGPWHRFVPWDWTHSSDELREAMSGVDVVFHLAGRAHASHLGLAEMLTANVTATQVVYREAQRASVGRFVYLSSVKAAGPPGDECVDETHCTDPETPYGISKKEAEAFLIGADGSPSVTILRPCLVYGPGWKGNLAKLSQLMRRGLCPDIQVNHNRRSMVSVDDVATAAICAAYNDASGIFILTDGQAYSTQRILRAMREALNQSPPKVCIPGALMKAGVTAGRAGEKIHLPVRRMLDVLERLTESAWYDSSRAAESLNWRPEITFERFLTRSADIGP